MLHVFHAARATLTAKRQPNLHHAIVQSVNHFSSKADSKKGAKHAAVDQPPVQGLPGPGDGQEDNRRSVSCLRSRSSAAGFLSSTGPAGPAR